MSLAIKTFERYLFHRIYQGQAKKVTEESREALKLAAGGLDTPWRVAAYIEAHLNEGPNLKPFRVPEAPEKVWAQKSGNAADYARLAQKMLSLNGRGAWFVTVYSRTEPLPQAVCAVREEGEEGWHHISNLGMFGMYISLEEVAHDLFADWWLMVVRNDAMEIADWQERKA